MVLAHRCMAFHPSTCGLRRGVAAVVTALIGYDNRKVEPIVIDYFLYTNILLCWIAAPTLIPLFIASSGNDP
jgi:hypothetical protein